MNVGSAVVLSSGMDRFVGLRLSRLRESLELSQGAFAEQLGVGADEIARMEKGERRLGAALMFELCVRFRLRPRYFFESLGSAREAR